MKSERKPRTTPRCAWLSWSALSLLAVSLLAFASCQTYDVVTNAPEEFWLTGEALLIALVQDLISLIDFIL